MIDYLLEISFPSDREDLEDEVSAALYLSACGGSSSQDDHASRRLVTAYFESGEQRAGAEKLLAANNELHCQSIDRPRQDWLDHYQQSLVAMPIGRRFIVAPDRSLITDGGRIPLVIPQEQAFGTGSHETTALCLEMLEGLDIPGRAGLDVGAGSAILAIAMSLLGARRVIAFDNDLEAIPPAVANLFRNGVEPGSLLLFCGTLPAVTGTFDVVTMNILPDVIIPLLPDVRHVLASDGDLILSGILITRAGEVTEAAEKSGLRCVAAGTRGQWWCGRFRRYRAAIPM